MGADAPDKDAHMDWNIVTTEHVREGVEGLNIKELIDIP
jgi:hypothetical protein